MGFNSILQGKTNDSFNMGQTEIQRQIRRIGGGSQGVRTKLCVTKPGSGSGMHMSQARLMRRNFKICLNYWDRDSYLFIFLLRLLAIWMTKLKLQGSSSRQPAENGSVKWKKDLRGGETDTESDDTDLLILAILENLSLEFSLI